MFLAITLDGRMAAGLPGHGGVSFFFLMKGRRTVGLSKQSSHVITALSRSEIQKQDLGNKYSLHASY